MNTPSHWLMTIAAGRVGPWKNKVPKWSLGLGAIAPDIPLYLLSFGGVIYYRLFRGWSLQDTFARLYDPDGLFFNDIWWIALHNSLHSPTFLAMLFLASWLLKNWQPKTARWCMFFLVACAGHSVIDVLTHHDDGPLLLFPFDWKTRFSSPVSYWDVSHHGGVFMVFEGALDLMLTGMLIYPLFKGIKEPAEHE